MPISSDGGKEVYIGRANNPDNQLSFNKLDICKSPAVDGLRAHKDTTAISRAIHRAEFTDSVPASFIVGGSVLFLLPLCSSRGGKMVGKRVSYCKTLEKLGEGMCSGPLSVRRSPEAPARGAERG